MATMKTKVKFKNIDTELSEARRDLVTVREHVVKLTHEHNKMCYDVHARIGMLMNQMSAVKGAPTTAKVAVWRDELRSVQADLKSMEALP